MAEAVGLAASVGQLTDLSLSMFKTLYQFKEEARDARSRIVTIAADVNNFREAMDGFQTVLLSSDISPAKMEPTWTDELKVMIGTSRTILEALKAELDKVCERPPNGSPDRIKVTAVQKLSWSMAVKTIERHGNELMVVKTTLRC